MFGLCNHRHTCEVSSSDHIILAADLFTFSMFVHNVLHRPISLTLVSSVGATQPPQSLPNSLTNCRSGLAGDGD